MTIELTRMQKEILRAIELHAGITQDLANRQGWLTHGGLPCKEFRQLIDPPRLGGLYLVAPRIVTSQPLRLVWQLRQAATHSATLAKIASEFSRMNLREFAPGGFQIETRKDLSRYMLTRN